MATCSSVWTVDVRKTSMDIPIAKVDSVLHANIAAIKGVHIADIENIDGVRIRDARFSVTVTA